MNEKDFLEHHGVKGMRWGVRRTPAQLGHKTAPKKKTSLKERVFGLKKKKAKSPVKKITEEQPKKTVKDMTDQELIEKINRLQLEQRYTQLNPNKVSTGKKFVDRAINNMFFPAAEDVGRQLIKSGMTKAVNDILKLDNEFKVYTNNKR